MAEKPKLTWQQIDGLEPRITVTMGGTIPTAVKFSSAKADLSLEMSKPANLTTEETIEELTQLIADKWEQLWLITAKMVEGKAGR